jgi:hypothetical protein
MIYAICYTYTIHTLYTIPKQMRQQKSCAHNATCYMLYAIHIHTYTYTHIHIYTYIYTHIHTHIYIHT